MQQPAQVGAAHAMGFHEVLQGLQGRGIGEARFVIALPGFDKVAEEFKVIGLVAVHAVACHGICDREGFAVVRAIPDRTGQ